jgi:hypothetical protein
VPYVCNVFTHKEKLWVIERETERLPMPRLPALCIAARSAQQAPVAKPKLPSARSSCAGEA